MESVPQPAPSGCHEFAAIQPRLTEITNHMHVAATKEQKSAPVATLSSPNKPATTLTALFAKLNLAVQPREAAGINALTGFWSDLHDQKVQPQSNEMNALVRCVQPRSIVPVQKTKGQFAPSPIARLIYRRNSGCDQFPALQTESAEDEVPSAQIILGSQSLSLLQPQSYPQIRLEADLKAEPEVQAQPLAPSAFDYDGDYAKREIFPRDAHDLGLESLEIASAGTRSTFDPALRTDRLLFRSEKVSSSAGATLEVFSGRLDGMVQQETVDGEDGSLILERKYDASVSANGLISESYFKCGNSQSISRMYDSTRNQYNLKSEKATSSSLGMRTEYGYQGRRDRLASITSLRSLSGVMTSEFVYSDGRVEHREDVYTERK